jgi:hypothetical protein
MRNKWNLNSVNGKGARFDAPDDFGTLGGLVVGGPESQDPHGENIMGKLKASAGDLRVVYGFAKPELQNLKPGTMLTCTPLSLGGQTTTGGTKISNPAVPGVEEGAEGACGQSSIIMVALYEALRQGNTFSDPTYLQENKHGGKYITTKTNIGCVQPSYLNGHTQFKDWTGVSGKGITKEQMIGYIHKSIQGGDPIVIFTSKGFAFSRSIHILCLVGYDDTTQTVIVNDPDVNQVNEYTNKNREGQLLTYDLLFNHRGDVYHSYNQFMIMRSTYTK